MSKKEVIWLTMPIILTSLLLFYALSDVSSENHRNLQEINTLQKRLNQVENELSSSKEDLADVALIKYQDSVVRKKYPVFSQIVDVVYRKSKEYEFNPNLIMSMILVESGFNPKAVSSAGAYGLMQVTYDVWKDELDIDPNRIFDIEYNIDLGLQILKRYSKVAKGDMLRALHLYNNGYLFNNESYKYKVTSTIFY
jgi:soluble lytic murein transglycosylase-like protein